MKNLKNLVVVMLVALAMVSFTACSSGNSPVNPVADVFSVTSVTYETFPESTYCLVYFHWNVEYTNNSGYQKTYGLDIEWGNGDPSIHTGGPIMPTVGVGVDSGKMNHAYGLTHGEVKVVNAKFTFTPPDSDPIVRVVPVTITTK